MTQDDNAMTHTEGHAADAIADLLAERDRILAALRSEVAANIVLKDERDRLQAKLERVRQECVGKFEFFMEPCGGQNCANCFASELFAILDEPNDVAEPPNPPHTLNECIFDGQCGDEHLQDKDATTPPPAEAAIKPGPSSAAPDHGDKLWATAHVQGGELAAVSYNGTTFVRPSFAQAEKPRRCDHRTNECNIEGCACPHAAWAEKAEPAEGEQPKAERGWVDERHPGARIVRSAEPAPEARCTHPPEYDDNYLCRKCGSQIVRPAPADRCGYVYALDGERCDETVDYHATHSLRLGHPFLPQEEPNNG